MTAEQVADLARKSEAKTLRMRFLFLAAFSLYMAVSLGARILSDETGPVPVPAGWIGLVRFALLIAWALTLRYYKKHEPISLFLKTAEFSGMTTTAVSFSTSWTIFIVLIDGCRR